ncbi:MAG TPA: GAF domain-containing protein [Conexibacter sp.]|nr:GAF domain-containing protein [Conexibacter sp.]
MGISGTTGELAAQLDQVRLESDTLYGVIAAIASSPDLDQVLDGIVDVLTKATSCHACFVYLRRGERLRLRAASRVYAHLVGAVEFGAGEGLAGWVMRRNSPAFIRENALEDPRTNYVPELEEERFQSMVAVPIPTRGGEPMGVIVLHTIAPREFDERTLNLLAHAAPLVAGAIENAQLYEDARRRVAALTSLSALSQRIAAVVDRADIYHEATAGVRALLGCDAVRLYEMDGDRRRLELVAADPAPQAGPAAHASATAVLLELLQQRGRRDERATGRLQEALELDADAAHVLVVPVATGGEHVGVLVAAGARPLPDEAEELLRAVANQVAVALKKAELIERLTEENIARDLLGALAQGRADDARARARQARFDLDRVHVFVHVLDAPDGGADAPWAERAERVEAALRRLVPGALCDAGADRVRGLLPLAAGGTIGELAALDRALADLGAAGRLAIGRSDPHRGAEDGAAGLREADDAARVCAALAGAGGMRGYRELGAYRYLVHLAGDETPGDPYLDAVRAIAAYDRRRGSQLVMTLEQYLADRRSVTETARALTVHPNTLRQRLDRIETLTGLDLANADLLALELAVKLARLQAPAG